jgi:hypothetical protein
MSVLVDRAIVASGLAELAEARRRGDVSTVLALAVRLEGADLLIVGALADRIRVEEVGPVVRIYANAPKHNGLAPPSDVVAVHADAQDEGARGIGLLRRVAMARILGPHRARIRVDWGEIGLELAQVALGFGANELQGPIANRRGLPIAAESQLKVKGKGLVSAQSIKRKELHGIILRAGREPLFEDAPTEPVVLPPAAEAGHA